MTTRSRRAEKDGKKAALERLLEERKTGQKRRREEMDFDDEDMFVEADEADDLNDFVVDDGVGYGEEDDLAYGERAPKQQKTSKVARQPTGNKKKTLPAAASKVAQVFLGAGRTGSEHKLSEDMTDQEKEFLNSLESEVLEEAAEEQMRTPLPKKKSAMPGNVIAVAHFGHGAHVQEAALQDLDTDVDMNKENDFPIDSFSSAKKTPAAKKLPKTATLSNRKGNREFDLSAYAFEPPRDDFANAEDVVVKSDANSVEPKAPRSPSRTRGRDLPPMSVKKELDDASTAWQQALEANAKEAAAAEVAPAVELPSTAYGEGTPLSETGELQMFWFDAFEDTYHAAGNIYLFGKALLSDKKTMASCCVVVQDIQRNVFVLPRPLALNDANDEKSVTDRKVEMKDVYSEFKDVLKSHGINKMRSKPVQRNDADAMADVDDGGEEKQERALGSGKQTVPTETQYLKFTYSAKEPMLPRDIKGKTFSKVFGTRSSTLELFLLKRDLMGPCWVTIKNARPVESNMSWCKFEYVVPNQKSIKVSENPLDSPNLSVCCLSLKTMLDEKTHRQEIVAASCTIHTSVSIEQTMDEKAALKIEHFSLIRKIPAHNWPLDFKPHVQKLQKEKKTKLQIFDSERDLLNILVSNIQKHDPDVLLGHDLHGSLIEILMQRMKVCKIPYWSKLGRLRKSRIPNANAKGEFAMLDQNICSGRLMCDTLTSAKELIRSRTYTLTELTETQLKKQRKEIHAEDVNKYMSSTKDILRLVEINEIDAFLTLQLMHKLVVLPLTKQLTCQCGNLWSASLRSARANRVEFLLLHEFHRNKFIIPEKMTSKERKEKEAKAAKAAGKAAPNQSGKRRGKPQYAGGLVLEPKRGFYDKFVLLLDFNSLYPSIIQEYNICFTTVEHWKVTKPGQLAEIPDDSLSKGVLPKVIQRLVERRRHVKALLKKEKNPNVREQLDIRQKAIKLVANSMYGCLGFKNSRFYCEPLAALITAQGRDNLQRTVELAQNMGQNVIYGDTDSVMIATNENELARARQIGNEIKKEVNKRFKVLEIEIDNVYRVMLLLRKKKYAALTVTELADGKLVYTREVKGLDLVRRDWCGLSKKAGQYVLDQILNGTNKESVVENILGYLDSLREDIKENRVNMDLYIITKGLTKAPKDYPDGKNQPHVQVALRMLAQGDTVRAGDHIPYIVCKGDGSVSQRCYHPAEVTKAGGVLEIDSEWYLSNQVLPPIARLCGPIEDIDAARIAHHLGLNPANFRNFSRGEEAQNANDDDDTILTAHQEDEEKYKNVKQVRATCPLCDTSFMFPGVFNMAAARNAQAKPDSKDVKMTDAASSSSVVKLEPKSEGDSKDEKRTDTDMELSPSLKFSVDCGLKCPNARCKGAVYSVDDVATMCSRLMNSIALEAREVINLYYENWFKCSDSSCGLRTRDTRVSKDTCIKHNCKGTLIKEYTAADLYLQLCFYDSLFDVRRANDLLIAENKRRKADPSLGLPELSSNLTPPQQEVIERMHMFTQTLLSRSAYHFLPPSIFATTVSSRDRDRTSAAAPLRGVGASSSSSSSSSASGAAAASAVMMEDVGEDDAGNEWA